MAQLTRNARVATGISFALLGTVYVIRGLGDTASLTGPRWLTWLSPIGWGQQFRPFAGDRWWVLAITLAFSAVTTVGAFALVAHRDVGAGVLPERPGPARGRYLNGPLALAWRLQRWSLLSWATGFALLGLVFGGIATNLRGFLDSPQARDLFTKLGGAEALTDAFIATELGFVAVFASAYGIQAALRLRSEEDGLRAGSILATATSRHRWALSHVVVAVGGTTTLMLVVGLSAGLAFAAQVDDLGRGLEVLAAALAYLPAVWVLTAIVVACFGSAPRLAAAGWVALVVFVLLGELGPLLELPIWLMDASPFAHIPQLPGASFDLFPLVGLTFVASVLIAVGLALFARRDVLG